MGIKNFEDTIINISEKPEEAMSDLPFESIKRIVKKFCSTSQLFIITWDFPKIIRVIDTISGVKAAEFHSNGILRYYNNVFKRQILNFVNDSKYKGYFERNK